MRYKHFKIVCAVAVSRCVEGRHFVALANGKSRFGSPGEKVAVTLACKRRGIGQGILDSGCHLDQVVDIALVGE